ncbi:MAG: lipoyl synthase [Verrucomicrobia bacterium]|nr:lipoyl synthase [Verrucomicrobiota bacterium]
MERKPPWLRAKIPGGPGYLKVRNLVQGNQLHTVCESAHCPNLGECWSRGTATIMILGETCTRSCRFCAIATGKPGAVDWGEPARVADAVRIMGLQHAVITSVARDDLPDGGAEIWARTVRAVRNVNPETHIEVLIPDFRGREESLNTVLDSAPDILNHNMETVCRLQKPVRVQAQYDRSLEVLSRAKARGFVTKTGLMLGIGEKEEEIEETLRDLADEKVDILTLGQYLRPTPKHLPVDRWVTPEEFARWKERALSLGFGVCESGPLVRSSYHAEEQSAKYTGIDTVSTKS